MDLDVGADDVVADHEEDAFATWFIGKVE